MNPNVNRDLNQKLEPELGRHNSTESGGLARKPTSAFTNHSMPSIIDNQNSEHLFVANLQTVSLEHIVRSKLEVLFRQQKEAQVDLDGLYRIVLEQVERPLIELTLKNCRGNQVKAAKMLGINRNTLKKKIDTYTIQVKNQNNTPS